MASVENLRSLPQPNVYQHLLNFDELLLLIYLTIFCIPLTFKIEVVTGHALLSISLIAHKYFELRHIYKLIAKN